ncbi:peptidoglycan-binding domain-containing protein [Fredinandcohnia sp. 179-A 10B2 NHS]|uniref:peptidoglycan-binding domain-containing protein n=1 Tax=Fredinandcohnia sp. 179-A 10B2 NHS TaxID=3235176 RepID=UPI0039A03E52
MSVFKRGDKGAGVLAYQEDLKLAGYEISADGSFGPETEAVTKQFQKDNNLIVDGSAGAQTLSAIDDLLMRKDPPLRDSVIFFLGKERYILGKL